jgi:hypothetical protein
MPGHAESPARSEPLGLPPLRVPSIEVLRALWLLLLASLLLYALAFSVRVYVRKYYVFLPDYLRSVATGPSAGGSAPTHVFVLFTDHFEPDYDEGRVNDWSHRYAALAALDCSPG